MVRSILSVMAGDVVWTILWLGSNAAWMNLVPDWYTSDGAFVSAIGAKGFTVDAVNFSCTPA